MGVGWGCGRGGSLDFRPYLVSTERKAWKLPTILILRPQGSSCFLRENKFPQVLSSSCWLQSEGTTPSPPISSSPPSHLYPRSHITPNPISCSPYAPSLSSPYMGVRSGDGLEPEGTHGHTWFCSPRGAWKEGISGRCLPRQVGTWPSLS